MKPSKSATIFIFDLLILYGSFFGVCISSLMRFVFLVCARHFVSEGYQQNHVLLLGGGKP